MKRGSISRLCLSVLFGASVTASAFPVAHAFTLSQYYKTLMAVRKCELVVEDEAVANLQAAIENKVTSVEASSDTLNGIFDELAAEIGDDTEAFCTDFGGEALEILNQL
jgi:hypothetical protein